jgi:NADPH2:quinone reductase
MSVNQPMIKALKLDFADAPFRLTDIPRPVPAPGEVLVRIHASGVNPLDVKIRDGAAGHARHPLPGIIGIDMAGVVEAVGSGVSRFKRGDEVFGMIGGVGRIQGSLAEYAAVDAALLAIKPSNVSMREAAAMPLAVITAWEGLVDRAKNIARPNRSGAGRGGGCRPCRGPDCRRFRRVGLCNRTGQRCRLHNFARCNAGPPRHVGCRAVILLHRWQRLRACL